MQITDENPELISALADGQLRGVEFAHTLEQLHRSATARSTWHAYHVVGDVLRSGESVRSSNDAEFVQRLRSRLQSETVVPLAFEPHVWTANEGLAGKELADRHDPHGSANEAWFSWKRVSGMMSLVIVSLIVWQFGFREGTSQDRPQLVQRVPASEPASGELVAAGQEPVMIRDAQLDALLLAHRQFGGTSALQMPAGFVRNATFEGLTR